MSRSLHAGVAQLGPIARYDSRQKVVARLIDLLHQARARGCELVVFPELALTTFFPRWDLQDPAEIDSFYEAEFPGPQTQALFDTAAKHGIGFEIGYAELATEGGRTHRYNSALLVDRNSAIVGKYRKVHLPGYSTVQDTPGQHLEKRYFEVGNFGFPVWNAFGGALGMCICNDRRWPETYRVMALQGVELICIGYNTPLGAGDPPELDALAPFHNHLVMQAGAYQNCTWVLAAAKTGFEEGFNLLGQSCIIAPSGEIVAMASTREDELISFRCNLDFARPYRDDIFNFAAHRRIEHYGLITERTAAPASN